MAVFTADPVVIAPGRPCLRISACLLFAYGLLSVSVPALQGIRKPMFALLIGLRRQIIAPGTIFWFLTRQLDFSLTCVWRGIFGINCSARVVALIYARRQMKKAATAFPQADKPVFGSSGALALRNFSQAKLSCSLSFNFGKSPVSESKTSRHPGNETEALLEIPVLSTLFSKSFNITDKTFPNDLPQLLQR
jgi:hypothetical protein